MKGPRELKRLVSRHGKELRAGRWDFLVVFKLERCKKWFKRDKRVKSEDYGD